MAKKGAKMKTPKLRFPEFRDRDGWKGVPLGDASTPVSERVGKRKLTPVSISAGIGFVPQTEKFGRDISGNQYARYTLVRDGDFVYNKGNSLKYPQGCVYQLRHWGEVAAPNVFISFRLKKGLVAEYFQYCFERNIHGIQLQRHITSGARSNGLLNVSKDQFFGVEIPTPQRDEQQKIADSLTSLDEVIVAQGRKVEALKAHKRGLMQQLFPREGEARPRLRFPEFRNAPDWKQATLGESMDVLMCKRIFASETNPVGGVPFYKIGTLGGVPDAYISKELFEDYRSGYNFPRVGEILITCSGTVGKCLRYDGSDAYFQDSNIVWIDNPAGAISNEFLFALISNIDWGKLNSTTIARLYGPDLRGLSIKYPIDGAEQQRIADCLSSFDARINAEAAGLAALETHKQGLMQQLFPAPRALGT